MEKRLRVPFIAILTVLMCFALALGLTAWNKTTASAANVSEGGTTVTFEGSDDFVYDGGNNIVGLSLDAKEKLTESITKIIVKFPTQSVNDRFAEDFNGKAQVELNRPAPDNPSLDVSTFLSGTALHKMNVVKVLSPNTRYFEAASDGTWCGKKSDGASNLSLIWSLNNTIPNKTSDIKAGALLNATEVTVPANVQIIDINAFDRSKLIKLTVDANNAYYGGGIEGHDCLLYSKSQTAGGTSKNTLFWSKDGYIPDDGSVTELAAGSLCGAENVHIPLSVTRANTSAFAVGETGLSVKYSITKALNEFIESPDIVRWIEGKFNEEENGFIGAAKFGNISYVITDTNDNVIYDLSQGIDNRASMKAGTYILKATVAGNDNYSGLSEAFTIRILEKVGLPWWGTLLIVLGSLMLAALIIFILWKKGVFQIMTEKIVVAIRTRASVDATIASVRAAKKEDEAKKTVAAAEARERAEARRAAAKAEREKPAEERAAALEAKAQAQVERAEKMRLRAEALQARAARLRGAEQTATEEPTEEAAATEETPTDE